MESDGISVPILTGENYSHWKLKMRRILEAKELDSIVFGDRVPTKASTTESVDDTEPKTVDKELEPSFKKKNARACMILFNALDEKNLSIVEACETAKEVWSRLELEYANKEPVSLEALLTEFYTYKKRSGQSISEYVAHIDKMVYKLASLGKPTEQVAIMAKITTGLPPEFVDFKRAWDLTPDKFKSMELLLTNLKTEEKNMADSKGSGEALIARGKPRPRQFKPSRGLSGEQKANSECKWCHQKGHWWKECPTRPADQKPADLRKRTKSKPTQGTTDRAERALCAKNPRQQGDSNTWYVDSGASSHMTGRKDWIEDYKPLEEDYPIQIANGDFLYAIGKGSVKMVASHGNWVLRLQDVYYVPGMAENLFSIGAAIDKGVSVNFRNQTMVITDGDDIIATGSKASAQLYKLDVMIPMAANLVRAERTLEEWHAVLGHADSNKIKLMAQENVVEGLKVVERPRHEANGCGDCQAGKGKTASHPESRRQRATDVLERIHMDLVGPVRTTSVGGKKYFILLKDEFSTYLFVEFMANKSEVADILKVFVDTVSNLTQSRIRYMRSDQGSEFNNQAVKFMCEVEGITTEFSAVYTPQQNGEAERANRTIIETARALLHGPLLPDTLWAEAVNCAVYTRNRIANSRTGQKTPFELFYGRKPNMAHMMRFGQQVHILDHAGGKGKFDAKTKEAFMVGYGPRVNTYRCVLTDLKTVVVTANCIPANHKSNSCGSGQRDLKTVLIIDSVPAPNDNQDGGSSAGPPDDSPSTPPAASNNDTFEIVSSPSAQSMRHETFIVDRPAITYPDHSNEIVRVSQPAAGVPEESLVSPPRDQDAMRSRLPRLSPMPTPDLELAPAQVSTSRGILKNASVSRPGEQNRPVQTSRAESARDNLQTSRPAPRDYANYRNIPPFAGPARQQFNQAQEERRPVSLQRSATVHVTPTPAPTGAARFRSQIESVVHGLLGSDKRKSKTPPMKNLSAFMIANEPQTYSEALSGPESKQWMAAIQAELEAHEQNGTWTIAPCSAETHEITAKWVFKKKLTPDGGVDRFKARLVARGFSQIRGQDYFEIFAPVVRMDSLRVLFAIAAQVGLNFHQFDIATAFLNGVIEEELYLQPPEGVNVPKDHTLKLEKSLYGLKQSPRCWNKRLVELLRGFNMEPCHSDPCVFVSSDDKSLVLALYVDDGLLFAQDQTVIEQFITYMNKHVKINSVTSSCFVGVEIVRNKDGSLFLHQRSYIRRILERFNMVDCKGVATPLETNHPLNKREVLEQPPQEIDEYAAAIGSLLYCCVATRPDLSYALSVLSKHTKAPREAHWRAVKRVLRYLKSTIDHGLLYCKAYEPKIVCYSDADWGGDQATRQSTSGMATFYANGLVCYKAQQQPVVALSTTEAEYIAASVAVKDIIWIQRFLVELKAPFTAKPALLCDNQSALKLIRNPEFHQRTKHIDIRFHFIRNSFEEGYFEPHYVETGEQLADLFTKSLSSERHRMLTKAIGCVSNEESEE